MRIKTSEWAIFIASLILILCLLAVSNHVRDIQGHIVSCEFSRFESFKLADELRQSSDDLTRMVRTYVATGDSIYEKYYYSILDIRNGVAPPPENYQNIYWDIIDYFDRNEPGTGEKVSLEELMRRINFSDEEFNKLQEAQNNSDELVNLERKAMAAMKGLYADENGDFTIKGEPDKDYAQELLHGEQYHLEKARIMTPIRDFFELIEARTAGELEALRSAQSFYTKLLLTLVFCCFILYSIVVFLTYKKVLIPIAKLQKSTGFIASGDYKSRVDIKSSDEIGNLADSFNKMASSIENEISNRQIAEKKIMLQSQIFENMIEGVMLISIETERIVFFNPTVENMLGYDKGELIGMHITDVIAETDKSPDETVDEIRGILQRDGIWRGEVLTVKKDTSLVWCSVDISPFEHSEYGRVWVAVSNDITRQKQLEEELKRLSIHDGLTGLKNRRHFEEILHIEWQRAIRSGTILSAIMIDIDDFKNYNDTYGHQAGDLCLKKVSETLSDVVSRSGDHVARYGGEEFVVLMPTTDSNGSAVLAEKLRKKVLELKIPHERTSTGKYVTISLGFATTQPSPEKESGMLIKKADDALYMAKRDGKNRVCEAE